MHLRLILAAALAVGLSSHAQAQTATVIPTCGTVSPPLGPGSRLYMDSTGVLCTTAGTGGGGGSGGATGSVTSAGTSGTSAQAVQGIVGGVPVNGFSAQFNTTLPTLASGATGYLAVDSSGRLIQSPGASVVVASGTVTANLGTLGGAATAANQSLMLANQNSTAAGTSATSAQAVQGVTGGVPQNVANAGTFAVQNTAAVVGGNAAAVKTDGSATTQPVSGTVTANVGTTNGLALDATVTARLGTLGQKASAASAPVVIASDQSSVPTKIDQTTPGTTNGVVVNSSALPTGSATSANQTSEITQLTAANQRAPYALDFNAATTSGSSAIGTSRDAGVSPSAYTKYNFWVYSSQASATNGFVVQSSFDNTNWFPVASYTLTAGAPVYGSVPVVQRYNRVVFTNGTTAGTATIATSLATN